MDALSRLELAVVDVALGVYDVANVASLEAAVELLSQLVIIIILCFPVYCA
jgi:hypothetical protein